MSDSRLGPILAAQPWRILRALREDIPLHAEPILRADEQLDSEPHATLCYELRHVLLPELAADGFVEFDTVEENVWRGPQFGTVRPLLELPRGALQELDAGPFAYDEGTETVRYYPDEPVEKLETFVAESETERDGSEKPD